MKNIEELDSKPYKHRVNSLLDMALVSTTAGAIAAMLVLFIYWHTPARPAISLWFGIYASFYLVRSIINHYFKKLPAEAKKHNLILRFHNISSVFVGLLWSAVTIYLLSMFGPLETLYILVILGGLIAGAMATNIIILSTFYAFVLPAALPVILYLVIQDNPQLGALAIVLSIYLAFISSGAHRLNKLVSESITYHFDNLQLLDELKRQKNHVSELFSELEYDLAGRKEAEEQLKIEKQRAEELANSLMAISTLDGLTGIPNRRHFDSTLAKEWNRACRSSMPISLIMCDIDFFKSYNDHYGHQKGDNCLIQVAKLLQEYARRDDDLAARYGGEEFAIILPATNLENAKEIAEQMRLGIVDLCIRHRYSDTDNIITASFGVATIIPQSEQPSKNLVSRADKALYIAKQEGRNRVVDLQFGIYDDFSQEDEIVRA